VIPAQACKCLATFAVCNEVRQANLVFVGTVESIEPAFLDPWDHDRLKQLPSAEILQLQEEATPASLEKLKAIYLNIYPNMSDYYRRELQAAATHDALRRVFEGLGSEGRQARIRVKQMFRNHDDDDGDDHDDGDQTGKVITVSTDPGDCGFAFQPGETYLIFADNDEETGQISTSICYRTARLSDAGADLAYLYYYKNGGNRSTRLEGFVTSSLSARFKADATREDLPIESSVPDAVVELKSDKILLHTRSDAHGKFIFDGLGAGDYQLNVFDSTYPATVTQLGFTNYLHTEAKSCARAILFAPKY
jgi:hypothetical protein